MVFKRHVHVRPGLSVRHTHFVSEKKKHFHKGAIPKGVRAQPLSRRKKRRKKIW